MNFSFCGGLPPAHDRDVEWGGGLAGLLLFSCLLDLLVLYTVVNGVWPQCSLGGVFFEVALLVVDADPAPDVFAAAYVCRSPLYGIDDIDSRRSFFFGRVLGDGPLRIEGREKNLVSFFWLGGMGFEIRLGSGRRLRRFAGMCFGVCSAGPSEPYY